MKEREFLSIFLLMKVINGSFKGKLDCLKRQLLTTLVVPFLPQRQSSDHLVSSIFSYVMISVVHFLIASNNYGSSSVSLRN